jgi:hypothetical protein
MVKSEKRQLKSSQAFHRTPCGWVRGTAVREQFELKNLELFDPVAQDKTGFHPATMHKQHEQKSPPKITQTVTHTNLIQEQIETRRNQLDASLGSHRNQANSGR